MSEVLAEEISSNNRNGIAVISGPSQAEDVAKKKILL